MNFLKGKMLTLLFSGLTWGVISTSASPSSAWLLSDSEIVSRRANPIQHFTSHQEHKDACSLSAGKTMNRLPSSERTPTSDGNVLLSEKVAQNQSKNSGVDIQSAVKTLNNVNGAQAGSMDFSCTSDEPSAPDLVSSLDGATVDLGGVSIGVVENPRLHNPFLVQLTRTEKTPKKVVIKYKNYRMGADQVCSGAGCGDALSPLPILTHYQSEDEEIHFDFSAARSLKKDEKQVLEFRMTKPDIASTYYVWELSYLDGLSKSEASLSCHEKTGLGSRLANMIVNSALRGVTTREFECQ